jgi:hypothetical protein
MHKTGLAAASFALAVTISSLLFAQPAPMPPPAPIMPPSLPPSHVVNLMTNEGSAVFGAQWRVGDVKMRDPHQRQGGVHKHDGGLCLSRRWAARGRISARTVCPSSPISEPIYRRLADVHCNILTPRSSPRGQSLPTWLAPTSNPCQKLFRSRADLNLLDANRMIVILSN